MKYSLLTNHFRPQEVTTVSLEDRCLMKSLAHFCGSNTSQLYSRIQSKIQEIHNLIELSSLLSNEELNSVFAPSTEGLGIGSALSMIRNALIALKNFFIDLLTNIIAFFKQLFDANTRNRAFLNRLMIQYIRTRSQTAESAIPNLKTCLLSYKEGLEFLGNLFTLYHDTKDASTTTNISVTSSYRRGLNMLGYVVDNGEIFVSTQKKELPKQIHLFGESVGVDSDNRWTTQRLSEFTTEFCKLLIDAEDLNAVKVRLENEVNSAIRTIDRFMVSGKIEDARVLQEQLNELSLRQTYVFKCNVIFQSYVSGIGTQLIDVWNNILGVNKQYSQ